MALHWCAKSAIFLVILALTLTGALDPNHSDIKLRSSTLDNTQATSRGMLSLPTRGCYAAGLKQLEENKVPRPLHMAFIIGAQKSGLFWHSDSSSFFPPHAIVFV